MFIVSWAQRIHKICELVRLDEVIKRNGVAVEELSELLIQFESSRFAALLVIANTEGLQQVGLVIRNITAYACRSSTSRNSRDTFMDVSLSSHCNGI